MNALSRADKALGSETDDQDKLLLINWCHPTVTAELVGNKSGPRPLLLQPAATPHLGRSKKWDANPAPASHFLFRIRLKTCRLNSARQSGCRRLISIAAPWRAAHDYPIVHG
jgi:hypothetical protein